MKRILILLLVFLMSCNSPSTSDENWRTGTHGVTMNFVENNPSSELLSTQHLNIMVQYANRGAYDISDLRFYLTGYDPTIFLLGGAVKEKVSPPLQGKNLYNPEGSQVEYIEWESSIRSPADVDSFKQDLTVTACYRYQTLASPNICVDPKKYDFTASGRCKYDIEGLGSSQGGPIAITGVKQKSTDDHIYVEINFNNKGSGVPYTTNLPTSNCYNNLKISDVNTLNVKEVSMSGRSFNCKPAGIIRLTNGAGSILCDLPISGESYYVTPLRIVLEYNYRETISKAVTITNVN